MMRIGHRLLQKTEGIGEQWFGFTLKTVGQRLHRNLGGDLAVMMPAHAISDDHEQRISRVTITDAVLVIGAPTLTTFLINGESH